MATLVFIGCFLLVLLLFLLPPVPSSSSWGSRGLWSHLRKPQAWRTPQSEKVWVAETPSPVFAPLALPQEWLQNSPKLQEKKPWPLPQHHPRGVGDLANWLLRIKLQSMDKDLKVGKSLARALG